jgi:anti-sigma B factor antagonist
VAEGERVTFNEEPHGAATVLVVAGRIDSASADTMGARLGGLLQQGRSRIAVDLRQIVYISSAGFRILLIAARQADKFGGRLALCCLTPQTRRMFELGSFFDVFEVFETKDAALAYLKE